MKKILVIDDEPDIVALVKTRLEANNFQVVTATDGEDGLTKVKSEKPNLIILDISMPGMDGFTFIQEYKKVADLRTTPIVVLTAKKEMNDLFKNEGVKDYIIKPFKPEELLATVKKYLG